MMKYSVLFAAVSLALAGCGGSSSGTSTTAATGDVVGLIMPDSLSVVTAESGGSTKLTFGKSRSKFSSAFLAENKSITDVDSDFVTDPINTYVYDASMQSLDTVNMILCLMEQTRASDMVNKGAYIALVNEDKCEQGQNQSSSGSTGQSSGGGATEFNSWTVISTRASDTSDQIVKMWIPGETGGADPMDGQTILVEVVATDGVSASKPFGGFSMNFKGVLDLSVFDPSVPVGTEVELMKGLLKTIDNADSKPQFSFINVGGTAATTVSGIDFSFTEAANVILDDANGTGGIALTENSFTSPFDNGGSTFAIAFDNNYLLRGNDTDSDGVAEVTVCKSRTQFDSQVWRYNLYHTVDGTFNGKNVLGGDRVELNSGFPFTYDSDSDGTDDVYGWVGYHGLWSGGDALADGATIVRFDYVTDTKTNYTVNIAPGKLIHRSAISESLSSFQGDEFQFWGQHPNPNLSIFGQWIVTVDVNNDFQITGSMSWGDNGPEIATTIDHDNDTNTAEVSVAAQLTLADNENIWFWSDALGGNISYVHDTDLNITPASARTVTFYQEEFVSLNDSTLFSGATTSQTLYCYDRCLKGGLTQAVIDAASNESDLYYTYTGTPLQYTISISGGKVLLTDDSNSDAEVSADGLNLNKFGFTWGINTGEMLITPLADPNQPWLVFEETNSYRWETGSNDWNHMVTVVDPNGDIATFDKPMQFAYTHTTVNDANADSTYDGKKFLLDYQGAGELFGFPWVEDTETMRWNAAITLKDAAILTNNVGTFAVKAVELEQSMQTDANGCTGLDIALLYNDASLALPLASSISAISFALSDKPTVTAAPAVIEGELQ